MKKRTGSSTNVKISDSKLNKLWRAAVLNKWQCDPLTGERDFDKLQCHHYVRRKHYLTRWDWRNGIPLTVESHRYAHTGAGQRELSDILDAVGLLDYLDERERIMKKDYLMEHGISDEEYRQIIAQELREAAESMDYLRVN